MTTAYTTRSEQLAFGGIQGFYTHHSAACQGPMNFAVYVPKAAREPGQKLPVLYYLAGLTCTEETFVIKAGAQRVAAELGLILVTCDTSPRTVRAEGDDAHWDFGRGAGFYLDATEAPWRDAGYRMESYVTTELRALIEAHFPVRDDARGLFGHSMGGHGALSLALKHPTLYRSVSAFAPIVAPSQVPWGEKAFTHYLGADRSAWAAHDTCALLEAGKRFASAPRVDQGLADKFLQQELQPERLRAACDAAQQPLELHLHEGYDHSYYFIQSFLEEHLRHHARQLAR